MLIVMPWSRRTTDRKLHVLKDVVDALVGGPGDEQGDVLRTKLMPIAEIERCELRGVAEWLVGDPLDADVEPGARSSP